MNRCLGYSKWQSCFGVLFFIVIAFIQVQLCQAESDNGQPGSFLNYGVGARAIAMGRAFTGLADDASALYWNPGGLSNLKQNQVMLQYASLIDGNTYQYVGYGHIFPAIGTLSAGVVMLNQPEAEGRSIDNKITNSFSNRELGVLMGYGIDLTSQISAGGTLKMVNQTMQGLSGTGFGLDLGFFYRPLSFLNIGLNFQNLVSPRISLKTDPDIYPKYMVAGLGLVFFGENLKLDFDLSKNMDQNAIKSRFGVEVSPIPNFSDLCLRAGMDETEIGAGLGYKFQGFAIDYAVGFGSVEMMHKVTFSYGFGGFVLEAHAEPETFSPVAINKVTVIRIESKTKFNVKSWLLELFNQAGTSVKKYGGDGNPPSHIVWDGLSDTTNPMPDDEYKIILTITDVNGNAHKAPETSVRIQSILPLGVAPVEVVE